MELGFVSYNAAGEDSFQFVALTDISPDQVIFFTDNGVFEDGTFRTNEGIATWQAPSSGLTSGTVVEINITAKTTSAGQLTSVSSMNFATSGDQLIAYTGSTSNPTFIAALNNAGSDFAATASSSQTSALPPGLEIGISAVAVDQSNTVVFQGLTSGDYADIRASLFSRDSFSGSSSSASFSGEFSIGGSPPPSTPKPTPQPTPNPVTVPTTPPVTGPPSTAAPTSEDGASGSICQGYPAAPVKSSNAISIVDANEAALSGSSKSVTVEGVVVNDQRAFAANGFYMQAPASHHSAPPSDGDISQGIFVYCETGCNGDDFEEGDFVSVSGSLNIFASNPQITGSVISLISDARQTIGPANCPPLTFQVHIPDVSLPTPTKETLLSYNGMLLHFVDALTITNSYLLQYGEIGLSGGGRLMNPTMNAEPASDEYYELMDFNSRNVVMLDDVAGGTCPVPQLYFDPAAGGVRTGWEIPSDALDGTVIVKFFESTDQYFLLPNAVGQSLIPKSYDTSKNPRRHSLEGSIFSNDAEKGQVRIGGSNMLNYFTTLGCSSCRGADNQEEFFIQANKLYAVIAEMDAAVLGLQEVENDDGNSVLQQMVTELNAFIGSDVYDYVATGKIGGDAIRNAIIYQPALVTPVGNYATVTFTNPSDKSRPSLAQTFEVNSGSCGSDARFTFVSNHLKSKGSACTEDSSSADTLEGEANCGFTRLKHAEQLKEWLETDPTSSGSDNFVLVGDFNSYKEERAVKALTSSFVNLAARDVSEKSLYSLSFDGTFGTLDYLMASESMAAKCSNTLEWHINCDEPIITDYNDEQYGFPSSCGTKPPGYNDLSVFRASDHDPILTFVDFECSVATNNNGSGADEGNVSIIALLFIIFAGIPMVMFLLSTLRQKSQKKDEERNSMGTEKHYL